MITQRHVIDCLESQGFAWGTLPLQNGASLVVSARGGRVLGPFLAPGSGSVYWINPAFARPTDFAALLARGDGNLGGERLWLTPEVQYNVHDRYDFGTYALPPQLDPGTYTLDQPRPNEWRLAQEVTLDTFNTASGAKSLQIEIIVHPVEDPLRTCAAHQDLTRDVLFAGYEQIVSLAERTHDAIMSEAWNLIQVNPGGVALIPASPAVQWTDYYEPAAEMQSVLPHHVEVRITGDRRFKLGYKAAHTFGRIGYYQLLPDGGACLIVRSFFNNPSAPYIEEAGSVPGGWGDSIHLYNDDGALGGFGELEVHGQAIGGLTGRRASRDQFVVWLYAGPAERIRVLIPHLLGIG